MKTLRIDLPDHEAAALEHAANESGFDSAADLVRATVAELVSEPVPYDGAALTRDIATHVEAKAQGEQSFTPCEARARLAAGHWA